jgi:hypothetical protein
MAGLIHLSRSNRVRFLFNLRSRVLLAFDHLVRTTHRLSPLFENKEKSHKSAAAIFWSSLCCSLFSSRVLISLLANPSRLKTGLLHMLRWKLFDKAHKPYRLKSCSLSHSHIDMDASGAFQPGSEAQISHLPPCFVQTLSFPLFFTVNILFTVTTPFSLWQARFTEPEIRPEQAS